MTPRAIALLFLIAWAGVAVGQPVAIDGASVRGESPQTRKRLAEAQKNMQDGKWDDVLDPLQQLLDDAGDDLIGVDGTAFTAARLTVHKLLAKLPPEPLKKYRDRVEEPARQLLETGKRTRDEQPLHLLLDRYAMSRPAEDAHRWLAEFAFERGDFALAKRHWEMLLPGKPTDFVYPSPKVDLAIPRAKIVLATIFQRDLPAARTQLAEFRAKHAMAEGLLAGRTGNYCDTLQAFIERPPQLAANPGESWTAFAGGPCHAGVAGSLRRNWPSAPTWKTPIPPDPLADATRTRARPSAIGGARAVAFHPVVFGNEAFIADGGRLIGFDLATGTSRIAFANANKASAEDRKLPLAFDADFTLTATDTAIYARFGHAAMFPNAAKPSSLVCWTPTGVKWTREPPANADFVASWEAAPLVANGRVWAVFLRSEGGRFIHSIACYDDRSDKPVWVTDVCESPTATGSESRTRHEPLTLAGRNIVFCSHTGVIAAVNALSGKSAWAYRYPRIRKIPGDGRHRDIAPAVAADGRVFIAPTDADRLLAFDAENGNLLWNEGPIEVEYILGVAENRVVAAIAGPVRGVRAYRASDGSTDAPHGWVCHDDPGLSSFGRGLVADDFVAWPTQAGLYFLRLNDGSVARQPQRGPHGNLSYANGVLLVATPTEIWGYVAEPLPANEPGRIARIDVRPDPQKIAGKHVMLPKAKLEFAPKLNLAAPVVSTGSAAGFDRMLIPATGTWGTTPTGLRWLVQIGRNRSRAVATDGESREIAGRATGAIYLGANAILFGERRIARIAPWADDRTWTYDIPLAECPEILGCVVAGSTVVCRIGDHHLIGLSLDDGHLLWAIDGMKRNRLTSFSFDGAPRFDAHLYADSAGILVHLSNGRCWQLDADTGTILADTPSADSPWLTDPVAIDDAKLLVIADGPGRVRVWDRRQFQTTWTSDAGRDTSLRGIAAGVVLRGDSILITVNRNHGVELERLRTTDGRRVWPQPAYFPVDTIDANALTSDGVHLFVPLPDRIVALRWDTGREVWEHLLPAYAEGWQARPTRDAILVYPARAIRADERLHWMFRPDPARLFSRLAVAADDYETRTIPIWLLDAATGRVQRKADIAARGSQLSVELLPEGAVFATGGSFETLPSHSPRSAPGADR